MPNQMVGIYFINSVDKYKDSYKEFEEMNHFTCNIYIYVLVFFILIKKYTAIYMYLKKWFTLVGSSSTKLSSNTT